MRSARPGRAASRQHGTDPLQPTRGRPRDRPMMRANLEREWRKSTVRFSRYVPRSASLGSHTAGAVMSGIEARVLCSEFARRRTSDVAPFADFAAYGRTRFIGTPLREIFAPSNASK